MAVGESKSSDSDTRTTLHVLCARVRNAELRVEELASLVPRESLHPFLQQVAEDLADAVEHTPYVWLSSKVDLDVWRGSEEYLTVYLDERLLGTGLPLERLAQVRERVLDMPSLSKAIIDRAIGPDLHLGGDQ